VTRPLVALGLLATGVVAAAAPGPSGDDAPRPVLVKATAPLAHSNSHDGRAILTVAGMRPGDRRSGEVTIRNEGGAGGLALGARAEGVLATRLRLTVTGDRGAPVFDGALADAPGCTPLGDLAVDSSRTYRFTVGFDRGPDDNDYAGATARADFEWRDRCVPEPSEPALVLGDVRLAIAPGPYRFSRRTGAAHVSVRCLAADSGACRGRIELERRRPGQGRGIALAVGAIDIRVGARRTIAIRLNRRARRRIAGSRVVPVRAYVTARDARGRRHRVAYRDRLVYSRR
jgi:spore coat-associated protein N